MDLNLIDVGLKLFDKTFKRFFASMMTQKRHEEVHTFKQ